MHLTPNQGWELGLKCLGAVVWYLKECLVEYDILTLRRFEPYFAADMRREDSMETESERPKFERMVNHTRRNTLLFM